MHEPKASALRNRDRYCIIRVHHIKTRKPAKCVIYKDFIADHVTYSQPDIALALMSFVVL